MRALRRYQLILACVVLVLCFVLCNDVYGANKVGQRSRNVIDGKKHERIIDYSDVAKRRVFDQTFRSDLAPRYLVDPKAKASKRSVLAQLAADTCGVGTSAIISIPFTDATSTTVGATDNFNIPAGMWVEKASDCPANFVCNISACPAPQCTGFSGGFQSDRGYAYVGTGSGPDVAYQISFLQPANFQITLDPTDSDVAATNCDPVNNVFAGCEQDDMVLELFGSVCSNNPSDLIALADNTPSGNAPDPISDNSEVITITNAPAGTYNIVVDGYSYSNAPSPTAGPFTLSIACAPPNQTCTQPGAFRRSRR